MTLSLRHFGQGMWMLKEVLLSLAAEHVSKSILEIRKYCIKHGHASVKWELYFQNPDWFALRARGLNSFNWQAIMIYGVSRRNEKKL